MDDKKNNDLMRIEAVMEFLQVDRRTVMNYKSLKADPLPSIKMGGLLRFRRADIDEWLERRKQG